MKYLPFEHIIYRTDLPEQEVMQRLSDHVQPKKWGFRDNQPKDYEGFVDGNRFEINRIIENRNSFLPQINGIVQNKNNKTEVEVTMRLQGPVLGFLVVFCGFAICFFLVVMTTEKKPHITFFMPLFMLLFIYVLSMAGFKWESRKSKAYLKERFEAEIIKE
ncbi:hypothetical protein [Chryseobacterium sp. Mn2064]|uniref:hypothetical protein n=1 Tax=Chryseobacterium sp. Mn2064 TaxID=3395263 RepID=UPI003BE38D6F